MYARVLRKWSLTKYLMYLLWLPVILLLVIYCPNVTSMPLSINTKLSSALLPTTSTMVSSPYSIILDDIKSDQQYDDDDDDDKNNSNKYNNNNNNNNNNKNNDRFVKDISNGNNKQDTINNNNNFNIHQQPYEVFIKSSPSSSSSSSSSIASNRQYAANIINLDYTDNNLNVPNINSQIINLNNDNNNEYFNNNYKNSNAYSSLTDNNNNNRMKILRKHETNNNNNNNNNFSINLNNSNDNENNYNYDNNNNNNRSKKKLQLQPNFTLFTPSSSLSSSSYYNNHRIDIFHTTTRKPLTLYNNNNNNNWNLKTIDDEISSSSSSSSSIQLSPSAPSSWYDLRQGNENINTDRTLLQFSNNKDKNLFNQIFSNKQLNDWQYDQQQQQQQQYQQNHENEKKFINEEYPIIVNNNQQLQQQQQQQKQIIVMNKRLLLEQRGKSDQNDIYRRRLMMRLKQLPTSSNYDNRKQQSSSVNNKLQTTNRELVVMDNDLNKLMIGRNRRDSRSFSSSSSSQQASSSSSLSLLNQRHFQQQQHQQQQQQQQQQQHPHQHHSHHHHQHHQQQERKRSKRYCSARDPTQLAYEAPTVFEGKIKSMSYDRRANFSVTFEVKEIFKCQFDYKLPELLRLQFTYSNTNSECDIYREHLRPRGIVHEELEQGRVYILFVKQITKGNFTILGQPIKKTRRTVNAVRKGVNEKYAQPASIKSLTANRTANKIIVRDGDTLRLLCRVTGQPPPKVTWFKDGKSISRSRLKPNSSFNQIYQFIHLKKKSELIIRPFNSTYAGLYECRAKNKVHKRPAKETIRVEALSRNSPPSETSFGGECPGDMQSYCLNGATCRYFREIHEKSCVCPEGYNGERCQEKTTTLNTNPTYKSGYMADEPMNLESTEDDDDDDGNDDNGFEFDDIRSTKQAYI